MNTMPWRTLADSQRAQLRVHDVSSGADELVLESFDLLFEAPNWTLDGRALIVNGDGALYRVELTSPDLVSIPFDGLPPINNDHVLDPDGEHIFVSGMDFQIYRAPLSGGRAERITDPGSRLMHFLHGVSPGGQELAFVGLVAVSTSGWQVLEAEIYVMNLDGSGTRQITTGGTVSDGPEYHPSGEWIYFNTQAYSPNAQIARVRVSGSDPERVLVSDTVDWFPHFSPDGRHAVYLSYPPGTTGHPENCNVSLELVENEDWKHHRTAVELFGGQGTLNVNSWSPDGTRFAYVAYPVLVPPGFE